MTAFLEMVSLKIYLLSMSLHLLSLQFIDPDPKMIVKPCRNQAPMAELPRFFPAEDHSVFSQVMIDLFRVELIENVLLIYLSVILPGEVVMLVIFDEGPAGAELSILPGVFQPGEMSGEGVGYSHQVQSRLPDPVGEVV